MNETYCFIYPDERVKASKVLPGSTTKFSGDKKQFLEHLRKALYASKLISYAQGFMLLREAAKVYLYKNRNFFYGYATGYSVVLTFVSIM